VNQNIKNTTLRSPNELINLMKSHAKKRGISLNALMLQIFWEWLKANKD